MTQTDSKDASLPELGNRTETELDDLLGYAIRRTQLKIFDHFSLNMSPYDISPAQFCMLYIIDSQPGVTQSELAKSLDIDAPRIVNLVHKLEKRGLAARVRCKPDKRSHGLFLTKKGELLVKEIRPLADKSDMEATANLTNQERSQLLALLQKVLW